ncbi:hypothetical protein DICSQDRAFT_61140 [Dichomitus squalens LYAD-421 SS1]|uniref:Uncharacterized protein n=1 Tax=Dichomitus squalens (strain LYAD-421) TaxID=732165 RepID=R7SYP3_DICSQ|nr:uncharacterized protein DICSQDRAFT_61140 [Dichomitus squalens LYAD-421 SS1]EJF61299.1 hypothetical protein DICSQDRAFT_61140 [Dichomitus squalens LYAD-421 SS1]
MISFFPPPCPQLPEFQTLLVRGTYHASAPVHLLLSHCSGTPGARAICLTPQREPFTNALVELKDQWIEVHGGIGRTSAAALRTEILFVVLGFELVYGLISI